jgi:hypothetical protein
MAKSLRISWFFQVFSGFAGLVGRTFSGFSRSFPGVCRSSPNLSQSEIFLRRLAHDSDSKDANRRLMSVIFSEINSLISSEDVASSSCTKADFFFSRSSRFAENGGTFAIQIGHLFQPDL